jgi:Uma2 family endonuclease
MVPRPSLGPLDHGRKIEPDEFERAQCQEGYLYELIEGRVYVSSWPELPHDVLVMWIWTSLTDYKQHYSDIINYVSCRPRVMVLEPTNSTRLGPDLAAYHDFPRARPIGTVSWQDVSPVLVLEVVSAEDPAKDLIRNVELYELVPSIREYWILDPRADASKPALLVYRRRGRHWQKPKKFAYGATYKTPLLPGLTLLVDPRP